MCIVLSGDIAMNSTLFNGKKRLGSFGWVVLAILVLLSAGFCLQAPVHAEENILRVGFRRNAAPYHFIGKDSTYQGMHIDMMNWIARKKNIQVMYVPFHTNGECLNALNAGKIDVILGHKTNDSAALGLQYTSELSASSLCLVAPQHIASALQDTENIKNYRAVVEYGLISAYTTSMGVSGYLAQADQTAVLEALLSLQADIALCDRDSFLYLLHDAGLAEDYTVVRSYISPISYAMLLRATDQELFTMLDTALAEMRADGSYEEIYKRWTISDSSGVDPLLIRRIWLITLSIVLLAAGFALFNFAMNQILKRRVAEKTQELQLRMHQLQRESKIRYAMIEYASGSMVSFDRRFRIQLMNNAAIRMSGSHLDQTGSDVRKLPIFGEIIAQMDPPLFEGDTYDEINQPTTIHLGSIGYRRWYRYNCYRSKNELGESSVLMTVEDITAEERKKQELFEQEKKQSLNRLVAGIAHEIKNPLMAIRTAATLMRDQGSDQEVQEAFSKYVPDEVDRINQLVNGLIHYARPVEGDLERIELSKVVQECLYLTKVVTKKAGVFYRAVLGEAIFIFANRDKIKQAIINIIVNGVESMEQKLESSPEQQPLMLEISAYQDDAFAYVQIRDEGMGMSEEDIRLCTEPFYTTKARGTGLGLALVQQFIKESDGVLEVESELGRYTCMTLKFRRAENNETENFNY